MPGNSARELNNAAIALLAEQGFAATSMEQIADALDLPIDRVVDEVGTKESIVLSVSGAMLDGAIDALPQIADQSAVAGALLTAHCRVLDDIVAGTGPITADAMRHMGMVLMFTPDLQAQAKAQRIELLSKAIADHLGVSPGDRVAQYELTLWSAVLAATYLGALDKTGRFDHAMDIRTPEGMRDRLIRAFRIVMGQ